MKLNSNNLPANTRVWLVHFRVWKYNGELDNYDRTPVAVFKA